jgi:hypothetical protein
MQICDHYHDEIVYDCGSCPVCIIVGELDVSRRDAELLQSTIDNMQDDIDNLNAMILDLEKQLETGGAQVLHSITKKI